jgi:protein tyrosine phosphatase
MRVTIYQSWEDYPAPPLYDIRRLMARLHILRGPKVHDSIAINCDAGVVQHRALMIACYNCCVPDEYGHIAPAI